ncbi:MAG TPA: phosphate signaling complex protein PhoU [Bryobacteraceae bacterium]|nr:phosphate signaling complex protein PhoU [Bryobacteraceae bacterium]
MRHFVEELEQLKTKLLEMSSLVEAAIQRSISAVIHKDKGAADEVFRNEARINAIEIEVDEFAINLLALQQPMAADLRLIVAALKINTDLERMGDLAVNIAQRARSLMEEPVIKPMIDIPHIAGLVQSMVRKALDAFVTRDPELARSVLASDDGVDNLRTACYHELVSFMEKDPQHIKQALDLLAVTRNLERIADHSTNIAEDVLFLVKGVDVRHHAEARTH